MENNNIHHVPIVDGNNIVGIVSRTDIIKYAYSKAFDGQSRYADSCLGGNVFIEKLMTKTIKSADLIKHAVEMLKSFYFNSIPAISNEDSKLVGMVTIKDFMNYFIKQY